jgi:hypothetical protein
MTSLCIVQVTNFMGVQTRNISLNSEAHLYVHPHPFSSNIDTAKVYLSALRSLNSKCNWYVLGDDDTIFFKKAINDFIKFKNSSLPIAYGNLYDINSKPPWFTGGSGILLSSNLVTNMLRINDNILHKLLRPHISCACIDLPFTHVIKYLNGRLVHMPNNFLDSCLDCIPHPYKKSILTCHAVTLYRNVNMHASNKINRDEYFTEFIHKNHYVVDHTLRNKRLKNHRSILRNCK